jgi:PHP domain-containing protein
MKVMIHAHTTFSADGELSPMQLGKLARSRGFDAVMVTDHFESLKPRTFQQLINECRQVEDCLMVPGYERSFRGYHILALGIDEWFDDLQISRWAAQVCKAGGVVVAAHPSRYGHAIPDDILAACDAIEVWNSKFVYDGAVAPNPRAYALLYPDKFPLCSQDLHGVRHASNVGIDIPIMCRTGSEILSCMKRGEYRMTNGVLSFDKRLPAAAIPLLAAFHNVRRKTVIAAIALRRQLKAHHSRDRKVA